MARSRSSLSKTPKLTCDYSRAEAERTRLINAQRLLLPPPSPQICVCGMLCTYLFALAFGSVRVRVCVLPMQSRHIHMI